MRELDERNSDDSAAKAKIRRHCEDPAVVHVTRTATQDMGLITITKEALLGAIRDHVCAKRRVFTDRMDNNDVAFILTDCLVGDVTLYVKVRFFELKGEERMLVISAHPPRRW